MKKITLIVLSFFLTTQVVISQSKLNKIKSDIVNSVEKHSENLINIMTHQHHLVQSNYLKERGLTGEIASWFEFKFKIGPCTDRL